MRLPPFPNTYCLFHNSDTRFYALQPPQSECDYLHFRYEFPVLRHCSIVPKSYFPTSKQHSDISWHNSLIFKPKFYHFHTPLPRFHDAITYISDTNFLFYDTVQSFQNHIPLLSNHNFDTFKHEFHHFHTPLHRFHYAITSVSEHILPVS